MGATDAVAPERLGPQDALAGLALSDEAGWNQSEDDWMVFLSQGTVLGLRDDDARLIATAALLPYPPAAWISMVLVTASWRRQGLATKLINACLAAADAAGVTPWLDATPDGAAVYGPLGFHTALSTQRFRRQHQPSPSLLPVVDAAFDTRRQDLLRRDREAMDLDRANLLNAFCRRDGSRLYAHESALCLVRDGRKARQIGPLFAEQPAHAVALLNGVIARENGTHIIDVIDTRHDVIAGLMASGFVFERPFRRMRFRNPATGGIQTAIAIAGPEFG